MAKQETKAKKPAAKKPATKPTESKAKAQKFEDGKSYKFESNGVCPSMKKGKVFEIDANRAAHFVKNNYGKIID